MDFDKLVRDNVPVIIENHNRKYTIKKLNDYDVVEYLLKKLHEETDEVKEAFYSGSEYNLIEELGDVMECVMAIASKKSIPIDRINFVRENKAIKNGKFNDNIILLYVEGDKF